MPIPLIVLIVLALLYGFLNGFLDASSIVSTMISSRSIAPRAALGVVAVAEFLGPFLFGVAVARTVGSSLVAPQTISLSAIYAALLSALLWGVLTWYLGIPSSSSHALFGGMIGAVAVQAGFGAIQIPGLVRILLSLFISPVIGLFAGILLMNLVIALVINATPRINSFFKRIQILTGLALGLTHGGNDAQKTMGVIVLGLVTAGFFDTFHVPLWIVAISAGAMSVGSFLGGWRLIRTLGGRLYKIRPVHAFTSQAASAAVILAAVLLGGPVSATHVISSAIMGVGAAERITKVRWPVAGQIAQAWLFTIPVSALLAALLYLFINNVLRIPGNPQP